MLKIIVPLTATRSRRILPRLAQPHVLTEIDGQPLLESIVSNLRPGEPHRFVFVTTRDEVRRWAMDDVAKRIAGDCTVVVSPVPPGTPVFASLLAFDQVEPDDEILVAEPNRIFDGNVDHFLSHARSSPLEGCVASFRCTHPRWNYLRVENGEVLQVVERRPISDQAIAPVLWIRRSRDYFDAAERHVVRGLERSEGEGTSSVVNELVLAGRRIGCWRISSPPPTRLVDSNSSLRTHKSKSTPNFVDS